MISVNDFKTGMTIKYNGTLYQVIEFQHVKPGKGGAFVRSKLKNLDSSSVQDITFNANEKVEKAHIEKLKMQFLYVEGDKYVFMNMETYEQLEVDSLLLKDEKKYLISNMEIVLAVNDGRIIGVVLPEKIKLKVVECEPNAKGDTKSGGDKLAKLETGYELRVPLFIAEGEDLIINTSTGQYVSRA